MSKEDINSIFRGTGGCALLITDPHNLWYLSGYRGGEGMLLLTPHRRVLIVASRFLETAAAQTDFELIEANHSHKGSRILAELLDAEQAYIVGYEDKHMRCCDFSRLQNSLPQVEQWLPLDDQIDAIRQVKTPKEISFLERAAAIGEEAVQETLQVLQVGMTEIEAAAYLSYQMKRRGAARLSLETAVATGDHAAMPRTTPTERQIAAGDLVTLHYGCVIDGYGAEAACTVVMGQASARQKEMYRAVRAAQEAALAHLHAGTPACDVDAAARRSIAEAGFGPYFTHALGHGLGLYRREGPQLAASDSTPLKNNMVVTLSPGIYLPGYGGVRLGDMAVVEPSGPRRISRTPEGLLEL